MFRFIRAILFDLGGTLMYARDAWPPIEARADLALAEGLREQGIGIEPSIFVEEFRTRLKDYYIQREKNLFETTYLSVVRELLEEHGYSNLTEATIRSALDRLYAVTQSNWVLESDAISILKILKYGGYRMGIVSNAGDHKDVFQLVERFKLESYFDFVLTSATCSYRKPHTRIFEVALAHWNIPASEAVMVGDTLEADILGAQKAGLLGIWIKRRAQPTADELQRIKPDFSLFGLDELYPTIKRISAAPSP